MTSRPASTSSWSLLKTMASSGVPGVARVGPAKRVPVVDVEVDRARLVVIHTDDGRDPASGSRLNFGPAPQA
jgi:hypothetical protein